jgi:VCBS repeat-containing protein
MRSFSYTPDPNFNGTDSFVYHASDGITNSNDITVPINVAPVDDAPFAANSSVSGPEDNPIQGQVVATDIDSSTLTYSLVGADGGAQHGTVTLNTDGSFTYIPAADFNGTDSFAFKANDGSLDSNTALIDVTITPVNDAPVFTSPTAFSVPENSTVVGIIMAVDLEHDAFSFAITGGDDQAFFSINAHTGTLSFVNSPDFETPADANHDNIYNLDVSVTDVFGATNTETISVDVTNVVEVGKTINGGSGNDVVTGTTGNDTINGGNGNDLVDGGDGDDVISGGNGADTLIGGRGNDNLDGGNGNDVLDGGVGNNQLFGGNGNDILQAGDRNNMMDGGNGDDVLSAGNGNNALTGGNGNDTLTVGNGDNSLSGGNGNDILSAGNGNNALAGGDGNDTLTVGNGNNSLSGENGNDVLIAGNGNNALTGGNGNDTLAVGNGNNNLSGGNGNDILKVGMGNNLLTGGNGNDTFVFGPGFAKDAITDFSRGDHIEFDGGAFQNFQAIQSASHQVDGNTVISLDAGHTITLQNVAVTNLHASDFIVH